MLCNNECVQEVAIRTCEVIEGLTSSQLIGKKIESVFAENIGQHGDAVLYMLDQILIQLQAIEATLGSLL